MQSHVFLLPLSDGGSVCRVCVLSCSISPQTTCSHGCVCRSSVSECHTTFHTPVYGGGIATHVCLIRSSDVYADLIEFVCC